MLHVSCVTHTCQVQLPRKLRIMWKRLAAQHPQQPSGCRKLAAINVLQEIAALLLCAAESITHEHVAAAMQAMGLLVTSGPSCISDDDADSAQDVPVSRAATIAAAAARMQKTGASNVLAGRQQAGAKRPVTLPSSGLRVAKKSKA